MKKGKYARQARREKPHKNYTKYILLDDQGAARYSSFSMLRGVLF